MMRYGRRPVSGLAVAATALIAMAAATPALAAEPPGPAPAAATAPLAGTIPAGVRPLPAPVRPIRLDRLLTSVPKRTGGRFYGGSIALFQNVATGQCLQGDVAGNVTVQTCTALTPQHWFPGPRGSVINQLSRQCLSGDSFGNATTRACAGTAFQAWFFSHDLSIRNYRTGLCLDSDALLHGCTGAQSQKWIVWVAT